MTRRVLLVAVVSKSERMISDVMGTTDIGTNEVKSMEK
jgi:hypothetical protein